MGIREALLVWYCCRCIVVVAISPCCSSTLSNPITEGAFKRLGKVDSFLITTVSRAAIPKAQQYHSRSPEAVHAKDAWSLWDSHNGVLLPLIPSTLASSRVSYWDPLSLLKYRWVLPLYSLMVLGYTVHRCPLELYTSVGLICQAIESTQFNKTDCVFLPPAWRQSPSRPGHNICYSL